MNKKSTIPRYFAGKKREGRAASCCQPLLLTLEPRLMFDGAAAVDAAHAAADAAIKAAPAAVVVRDAEPAKDGGKKEVAFIDTSVKDYKALETGIRDGVAIVEIGGGADGLAQMAQWAETHSGYDAIHVFSHGSEGALYLGTNTLTAKGLSDATIAVELSVIGQTLNADGDLILYGCNVAGGADGQAFVVGLANVTGADVAASTDMTGAAAYGGNWELEHSVGVVTADVLAARGYAHLLADVTFSGDTGTNTDASVGGAGAQSTIQMTVGSDTFQIVNVGTGMYLDTAANLGDGPTGMTAKYIKTDNNAWTSSLTITVTGGKLFDFKTVAMQESNGDATVFIFKPNGSSTGQYTSSFTATQFKTIDLSADSNFQNLTSLVITAQNTSQGNASLFQVNIDTFVLSNIHLPNAAPTNSVAPAISGGTAVGATFSTGNGTWSDADNDTLSYTYKWQSATDNAGTGAADIGGATSSTFSPTSTQAHKYIRSVVSANDGNGHTVAANGAWTLVTNSAPSNSVVPSVSGGATVTSMLSSTTGTWSDADGDTQSYTYQWYRADDNSGTNEAAIGGATNSTYTLGTLDAHKYLRVKVTANDGNGSSTQTAYSTRTAITNSAPSNSVVPTVSGTASIGSALSASTGTWSDGDGDTLSYTYQWYRADDNSGTNEATIGGATSSSYTLTGSDANKYVKVVVTANDSNGSSTQTAASTRTGIVPSITSATYNAGTGALTVTGINMGSGDTIDVSKLTLKGQGTNTYTLTSTNVTTSSSTSFTVSLNAADMINVNGLLNLNGTSSVDSVTYNLAAAANWDSTLSASADLTSNGVTVSGVNAPTITSATYDASTHVLTVTGTGLVKTSGVTNDITVSKLTLTGEGGSTHTLTTSDVEITSATSFSVTLNATDQAAVEPLLNKAGTSSTSGTTYNLAAADDWDSVITNGDISDTTNAVTVSNVSAPTITSATYNAGTGALVVTAVGLLSKSGATNDIDATKLTITGDLGGTYTLTSSSVDITDSTHFTITLNTTDKLSVNGLLNKAGTQAGDNTVYNLAGAGGWNRGDALSSADLTSNAITVSNLQTPTVTSATYNPNTGALVVIGTNFVSKVGATNDIDPTKLTLLGKASGTRALTAATSNVEITSATSFTLSIAGADKTAVDLLLDANGTQSSDAVTYNLDVAGNWLAAYADSGSGYADNSNAVTVSIPPSITSATYNATTGVLAVTGASMTGGDTIDVSKLTLTGEGGATYTLTTGNVTAASATSFSVTLNATDKAAVNQLLNKAGTSSTGTTTYNLAAADDWDTNVTTGDTSDATNGVTVSNIPAPTITSATYDYATNTLVVTGTGFVQRSGSANDVDLSKFTITGEAGATYTLASSTDVEITSGTQFTVTLAGADIYNVERLFSADGTASADSTTYNLAGAATFLRGDAAASADLTSNAVTVSNWAKPIITSTTFDWATGQLVLTGTNFVNKTGTANDVTAAKFTFTGEGGTYALTNTTDVEVTSATTATITLSATDLMNVRGLLNKNGTSSSGSTTYNVAAADDWMGGSPAAQNVADATTPVTVSNVSAPTLTSATYDAVSGVLTVTGTNLFKKVGGANDIDVTKLTLKGKGGTTYTLTTTNVEITSATSFTLTLNATDKAGVNLLVDKNGLSSLSGVYNIAGADGWLAGRDTATNIADPTNNGVTVSGVVEASNSPPPPPQPTPTGDAAPVKPQLAQGPVTQGDQAPAALVTNVRSNEGPQNTVSSLTGSINATGGTPITNLVSSNSSQSEASGANQTKNSVSFGTAQSAAISTVGGTPIGNVVAASMSFASQKTASNTFTGAPGSGGGIGGGVTSPAVPTGGGAGSFFSVAVAPRPASGGDALVVNSRVPDVSFQGGSRISVSVPSQAFAHTRADAAVTLVAQQQNGTALPGWLQFNPRTGTFEGTPPPGFRGDVTVKVTARDSQGREAVQTFKISVGAGGQGNVAPDGGQGQPGGASGRTGDLGLPHKLAKAVGKPSLTEQLRSMTRDGAKTDGRALLSLLQGRSRVA